MKQDGPEAPDGLSRYAQRLLKEKVCFLPGGISSQNDPNESKIRTFRKANFMGNFVTFVY